MLKKRKNSLKKLALPSNLSNLSFPEGSAFHPCKRALFRADFERLGKVPFGRFRAGDARL
jgi:hypothetical protein